jgi:acetylornithine deacetylase
MRMFMNSRDILERLVGFKTVSRDTNLDLIDYARTFLAGIGASCRLYHDPAGRKANLFATIGPSDTGGILLSGHTDVVPVDGQNWSSDPFLLRERNGKLYARGSADMKSFLACSMAAAARAAGRNLRIPLHLAFSYDEEIGCIGVRSLIEDMSAWAYRPQCCIVGEPTLLRTAIGHKGKTAISAICHGQAAHSAMPASGVNAIYLASALVGRVQSLQRELEVNGPHEPGYEVPYTTLHVGTVHGGTALNIVPERCELEFEIRNLPTDDPDRLVDRLRSDAESIAETEARPGCRSKIEFEILHAYPGLDTPSESEVVGLVSALTGQRDLMRVSFGTEGGLFSARLGIPTVVCGPGSIEQAHKPDEFVTTDQILRCDRVLDAIVDRLT